MTNNHTLLSKALVLHLFTPICLKFNSILSIYLNLGLPFFFLHLPGLPSSDDSTDWSSLIKAAKYNIKKLSALIYLQYQVLCVNYNLTSDIVNTIVCPVPHLLLFPFLHTGGCMWELFLSL